MIRQVYEFVNDGAKGRIRVIKTAERRNINGDARSYVRRIGATDKH